MKESVKRFEMPEFRCTVEVRRYEDGRLTACDCETNAMARYAPECDGGERLSCEEGLSFGAANTAVAWFTCWEERATDAEKVATLLGDGRTFVTPDGERIEEVCDRAAGRAPYRDGRGTLPVRFEFPDGSAIVLCGRGWGLQHPNCTCGFCRKAEGERPACLNEAALAAAREARRRVRDAEREASLAAPVIVWEEVGSTRAQRAWWEEGGEGD